MPNDSLSSLFEKQYENQAMLIQSGKYDGFTNKRDMLPSDDPKLCSYHIQQLVSEIGEVLEADKRWKNFRNDKYDKSAKADEIADCFIVLMNVAMFSGMTSEELYEAVNGKIEVVHLRIQEEQ